MSAFSPRPANGLLSRLPPADFARLEPLLRPHRLEQGQVLFQSADPIREVWFPLSAVVSLCSMTADSGTIEVGMVGPEGAVGCAVALGRLIAPHCPMVLLSGDALRLVMQRPWLTQTAQRLQDRGLIRCQRGDIEILNREALREAACECYPAVQRHFATFLERCCPGRNGRGSD
jgi:CRP-like cAMP-binding protein